MRHAVRLGVEGDDIDDPHDLDVVRDELRCGADDRGILERFGSGEAVHADRPVELDLAVEGLVEPVLKSGGPSVRLKSIRAVSGSMVPPVTRAPKSR